MNGKYVLQILGSLEEFDALHSNENYTKVAVIDIDLFNFGLLVYTIEEYSITFLKLNVKQCIYNEDIFELNSDDSTDREDFKINLLNVFSLPFALLKIIYTSKSVWAIGQQFAVDLKPYLESVIEKTLLLDDEECMDTGDAEEFSCKSFDIPINLQQCQKLDLHPEDIFIGCSSLEYGFILCHKNSTLNAWQLELVSLNNGNTKLSDVRTLPFLDFPVSFSKRDVVINSTQGRVDTCDPVFRFIHHSDSESHAFREIFGINCPSPNILCLVGHSDGKLLWSLCDYENQFHPSHMLQTLYDIKQPVVGIYFQDDIEEFEGYGCMLVVGALGQITLFSSKKHSALTLVPGQHPFWIATAYLKSPITSCAVVKGCLIHLSNGTVWITELSMLINSKGKSEKMCLASNSSELSSIQQMVVINKSQGLMLFLTSSGNIYLTICKKKLDPETVTTSLPSLMNECLQQSTVMHELLHKKVLQRRLFSAISAFSSLKFCTNTLKDPITFSISEVNLEPRKYILVINLKSFEELHLDPELCHVTSTIFTYFEKNFSLVTKTSPYNADQPTLCLELTDTVLQPPFVSIFPLFVEVGLILQLPDNWRRMDCFKPVSNCLPFYLRVQTFMVHELHLFQENVLCPTQSFKYEKPKTMKIIQELAMKRPISNILQAESRMKYELPTKFNLCLSMSSVKEMMKNNEDSDPCEYIKNILLRNKHSKCLSGRTHSAANKSPISVEISNKNDIIVISLIANSFDSLIGLRIAVMDILLATWNQSKHSTSSSTFVSIPANIYKKCEDISKYLMNLYGKDVESEEVTNAIIQLYQELRREVSAKLPIL